MLAALLGTFNAISQPAEFALVPVIGGDEDSERLTQLNGYVESARYGGMIAGPVVGGALSAAGGVDVAMLINAVTFLAVAVAGALLRARRPPQPRTTRRPSRRASATGS